MHSLIPHLVAFALAFLSPVTVLAGNTYFTMTTPKVLDYADSITLTWATESSTETYEIGLAQGPMNNLVLGTIINGGFGPGTSYTWTALDILPSGTYVFYIQQKSNGAVNYSPYFCLQECSSTTSTSAAPFAFASGPIVATSNSQSTVSAPAITSAAAVVATVSSAPSAGMGYISKNLSGTVQYYNASGYGSTVEGSGNVMEFTGGALKASMMGAGAMMAVVASGVLMVL